MRLPLSTNYKDAHKAVKTSLLSYRPTVYSDDFIDIGQRLQGIGEQEELMAALFPPQAVDLMTWVVP